MKKHIYILAAVFLISTLSGCKSKEKVDLSGIHTTEAETLAPTAASTETAAPTVSTTASQTDPSTAGQTKPDPSTANALSVRSKIATEKQGKISVEYPILSNLPSDSPTDAINALIKEKATQFITACKLNPETATATVKCEVLALERKKAIFTYTGFYQTDDAADKTTIFFTTTIDLAKGRLIGLSDYADAYTMAGYMRSDDCVFQHATDRDKVHEELKATDIETLTEILEDCDFKADEKNRLPRSFSYELGGDIFMAVPVSRELGGYAIVRYTPDTK